MHLNPSITFPYVAFYKSNQESAEQQTGQKQQVLYGTGVTKISRQQQGSDGSKLSF